MTTNTLLCFVVLAMGVMCTANDVPTYKRYGIANKGVLDQLHTDLMIGLPQRPYRVRVVFSRHEFERSVYRSSCPLMPHIVLFTDTHQDHSFSYETIANGCIGRDVVDWMGLRWIGVIGMTTKHRPPDLDYDGVMYLGILPDAALPNTGASAYVISRNALDVNFAFDKGGRQDATFHSSILEHTETPLWKRNPQPGMSVACVADVVADLDATRQRCGHIDPNAIGFISDVDVRADGGYSLGKYTLCIAPDNIASYLPVFLFQKYFRGKNTLRDNPRDWDNLGLHLPHGECEIKIRGRDMLPSNAMSPGRGKMPTEHVLQSMLSSSSTSKHAIHLWSESSRAITDKASTGFDALKVHPHYVDNTTIVIAGNLLWSAASLVVSPIEGRLQIVAMHRGLLPTIFDIILVVIFLFIYLRWKSSGRWTDTCKPPLIYYVVITKISIITGLAIFAIKIFVFILYFVATPAAINSYPREVLPVIWFSLVYDAFLLVLFLTLLRDRIKDGLSHLGKFTRRVLLVLFNERRAIKENAAALKREKRPYIPCRSSYTIRDKRSGKRRVWDPNKLYATNEYNSHFLWIRSGIYSILAMAIDVVALSTIFLIATATEDRLFIDIVVSIAYVVFIFQVYYTWLVAVTMFDWRVFRGFNSGHFGDFFATLHGFILCTGFTVYAVETFFFDLASRYSSLYEAVALRLALYFFSMVILLVASILAYESVSEVTPTKKDQLDKQERQLDGLQ